MYFIFDFDSMERILERYERYSYAERQLKEPDLESPVCMSTSLDVRHCVYILHAWFHRQAGLWSMLSSRLEWRFCRETRGTGQYILIYIYMRKWTLKIENLLFN